MEHIKIENLNAPGDKLQLTVLRGMVLLNLIDQIKEHHG